MNQKEYTLSNKDKKFLAALMLLHLSVVMMTVSFFGLYYQGQTEDCRRMNKRLELADWATGEVNKIKAEQKLESIKKHYESYGIKAEEF